MSMPQGGGPITEAGRVATSAIDALKVNPSCLAAIMLAAIFAGVFYLTTEKERELMHERQMLLLSRCYPMPHPGGPT